MAFPKKISDLPKAGSIKNSDLFVLVHDGVTSQVRFDRLIFSADSNTFITGGTLTGTNLILEKNISQFSLISPLARLNVNTLRLHRPVIHTTTV